MKNILSNKKWMWCIIVLLLFVISLSSCTYSERIERDGLIEGYIWEGFLFFSLPGWFAMASGLLGDFFGITINHDSFRINGKRYDIEYTESTSSYPFIDIIKNKLICYFAFFGPLQLAALVNGIILYMTGQINMLFETVLFIILILCSYRFCLKTEKGRFVIYVLYWINVLFIAAVIIGIIGVICYFMYNYED